MFRCESWCVGAPNRGLQPPPRSQINPPKKFTRKINVYLRLSSQQVLCEIRAK